MLVSKVSCGARMTSEVFGTCASRAGSAVEYLAEESEERKRF